MGRYTGLREALIYSVRGELHHNQDHNQGQTQCCSLNMNLITLPGYANHTEGESWRGKLRH